MDLILSLDTSTTVCSVALHQADKLLTYQELHLGHSHSSMLTTLCQQVVDNSGYRLQDLSAVAVAKGPGSYTGLRIGAATAKGLCYALDKPLLAVNTLAAMAAQIAHTLTAPDALICPMIDARRMEVYCGIWNQQGQEVSPTEAKILEEHSFAEWLQRATIVFVGDGALKARYKLAQQARAYFMPDIHPSAKWVGLLAHTRWAQGLTEDLAYFEPFYLKDFIGNKIATPNS